MIHTQADPFRAIADPGRREILRMLSTDRLSVNEIARQFDISRPAISRHIKILNDAGFVEVTVEGREHYCELNPYGFNQIKEWHIFFEQFWDHKLRRLGKLLDKRHQKKC